MKKTSKKCMMNIKGKCNSDYYKNKPCNLDRCPYKSGGTYAMAVYDRQNWRKK